MADPVSGYAMEWAHEIGKAKQLPPDQRAVFVTLAYYANRKSGWAWVSRAEIMAATGFGHGRVIRALAGVEATGVIGVERRAGRTTRWGPFPTLVMGSHPRGRGYGYEPEPDATRADGGTGTRADGGTTPARTGARDPLEDPLDKPRAVAARRAGKSTWTATLTELPSGPDATPPPEPYVKCPECGGVGFVVVGGRRSVCRNMAAHRG